jgi:hypothetical protein
LLDGLAGAEGRLTGVIRAGVGGVHGDRDGDRDGRTHR